jgi:hypothetical protein
MQTGEPISGLSRSCKSLLSNHFPSRDGRIRTGDPLNLIQIMTFGLIDARVSPLILVTWECLIGVGLVTGMALRATFLLLLL